MLTRLREIVEKVASAPRLNEALDILVTDICAAMETEVCSVYLADHDRRCYYLMATRGLKKPRGRIVALAFDEGLVGLVGRLAEPINLADAQKHPSFKYIPAVKEGRFRAFLGVPIIQRRQLLGVLVVQQRELRQFDESEESFLVTLATQIAGILSQSQLNALFGQYRQHRIRALPGPEYQEFDSVSQDTFWRSPWQLSPQSNRMAYRLQGQPLKRTTDREMLSHGLLPGVVQVPHNGQPIVLMNDAQTTGGYPRIATIIEADMYQLAQIPLGQPIHFVPCSLEEALKARADRQRYFEQLAWRLNDED